METLCLYYLSVVFVCLRSVSGRPNNSTQVDVNTDKFELTDEGGFVFSFTVDKDIHQEATGELKTVGTKGEVLVVKGVYEFLAPNGFIYIVRYTADENGYRPVTTVVTPLGPRIGESALCSLCGTGLG